MKLTNFLLSKAASSLRGFRVEGLCAAPLTPFRNNGDVNPDVVPKYIQQLKDFGIPNAYVNGTSAEANSLTLEERKEMAKTWKEQAKDRLSSVIIHIGTGNLRDSQHLAEHAEKLGVDCIACVGPTYYKPENIHSYVDYMTEVASAAPNTPFLLYEIDFVTGITFDIPKFFHLAKDKIPALCGVKHSTPNLTSIQNMVLQHPDVQCFAGSNEQYLQVLSVGCESNIMNSHNGIILNNIRDAFNTGDMKLAREWAEKSLLFGKAKKNNGLSDYGARSAIMNIMGVNVGQPRLPLAPVTSQQMQGLKKDLHESGFFDSVPNNYK